MWVDVIQNTKEWFILRLKKATSSNFSKIMAHEGKEFGIPAIEYAQKVALEIVTDERDESSVYKNAFFDRGHDYEPVAINAYELETFTEVTKGGFNHFERYGDSPDGNIGNIGCVEVKTVIPNIQWKRIKKGDYDLAYKWQIQGHIWLGNKKWCDFISYCPEMNESKRLYIHRVYRDENMILRLQNRLKMFDIEVDKNVNLLKK